MTLSTNALTCSLFLSCSGTRGQAAAAAASAAKGGRKREASPPAVRTRGGQKSEEPPSKRAKRWNLWQRWTRLPQQCFLCSPHSSQFHCWGSESFYTQLARKAVSASLTVNIEKLWIVLYTLLLMVECKPEDLCRNPLEYFSTALRPYGLDQSSSFLRLFSNGQ